MDYHNKRKANEPQDVVQAGNRAWWTKHTMSYDWKDKVTKERFSPAWFEEIDRRFIYGARLFGHNTRPFNAVIPFSKLAGASVLEIGCGMGLHSELMGLAGANVCAVDISPTSIEATMRRAEIRKLKIDARVMDAVSLEFEDETFDFVWSWGVIHHSAQTGRIVKEIHRVLKPGGEVRVMVYNLEGMPAYFVLLTKYLSGFWRGCSLDECLWASTDGYTARFYTQDLLKDLFNTFFDGVSVKTLGQESDAVPLPRFLRGRIIKLIPDATLAKWANQRGAFLLVSAHK
jgi:2-polyprenyl-3-methyl-5-hydroxy-6-metoxy-1,4-benzoquinol methylase